MVNNNKKDMEKIVKKEKEINDKINAVLLVLNLIKNNFEFEKNEMTKSEIKEWVLANDLINDFLIKLVNQKKNVGEH